ncbi:uncharacterized protein TERG_12565 [Trichophyton rubrum CBS 118892]|uniref:Uncharacterized protein n=1 Tax=Trichophyton rubrum (strain ATCC MYA-4607 / CBS 118892) TaxID=559305 RepID=A0A080WXL4_TRIRC|nr:uncharacterized protein TERG_12565 [Trichophyton rubrum CBS 118892]KFL62738.1 hypothetical protein TERG_12565 [Trichophyton rubrum CBS 118892]
MLLASSHSILPLLERKKMEKTPRIDLLYLPTHKLLEETPWRYHVVSRHFTFVYHHGVIL